MAGWIAGFAHVRHLPRLTYECVSQIATQGTVGLVERDQVNPLAAACVRRLEEPNAQFGSKAKLMKSWDMVYTWHLQNNSRCPLSFPLFKARQALDARDLEERRGLHLLDLQ